MKCGNERIVWSMTGICRGLEAKGVCRSRYCIVIKATGWRTGAEDWEMERTSDQFRIVRKRKAILIFIIKGIMGSHQRREEVPSLMFQVMQGWWNEKAHKDRSAITSLDHHIVMFQDKIPKIGPLLPQVKCLNGGNAFISEEEFVSVKKDKWWKKRIFWGLDLFFWVSAPLFHLPIMSHIWEF